VTYGFLLLSYLMGAIPTSFVVGRVFHGVDLREHGSGNLGATNALRVLGWRSALPVMLFDIAKGFVPVRLFPALVGVGFGWTFAFGVAAILGHVFSVFVRFRGGKGMATSMGVMIALAPWAALLGLVVFLVFAVPTGYVSLGSILSALSVPLLIAITPHQGGWTLVWLSSFLAAFVTWAHRSNIRRLLRGEENRFGHKEAEPAAPETGPSE